MSWGVLPWVYPVWDSLGFLELGGYFFPHFREFFNYYLLKYFLMPFLFVFFFWDIYDSNVGAFNIVPEVSEVVLISFNSFIFIPLCFIYFHHSIIDWLFFISSRSFLNIPCIFSILGSVYLSVTPFCFQDFGSSLVSLFCILFQVDSLSPLLLFGLVGFYHIFSPAEYFSAFSFCLDCCIWGALSAGWKFMVPLNCGVCSLWVGLD